MNLLVQAYFRDKELGEIVFIEDKPSVPCNDLFGTEKWRKSVWSSDEFKKLGCELLSSLFENDLYAEKGCLNQLEKELHLILNYIVETNQKLNPDEFNGIEFRVRNALEAIRIARKYKNGGVYIG